MCRGALAQRPKSGLACHICAMFARQRYGHAWDLKRGARNLTKVICLTCALSVRGERPTTGTTASERRENNLNGYQDLRSKSGPESGLDCLMCADFADAGHLRACALPAAISSGRVFVINTRAQRKLLHTWIIVVIVQQHLVQIGQIDGPTECSS